MKTRGLPGMFAPMYQVSAVGNSDGLRHLLVVRDPGVLGLGRRLDGAGAAVAHRADDPGDELDVLLDRHRHVRQHRRALRAGDGEQVRVSGAHQPQVGARPVGPLVPQQPAVPAPDVDLVERPGHRVEAGGVDDGVELVLGAVRQPQPGRGDLGDRVGLHVDQVHVRQVERLVVPGVQRDALAAERIALRGQQLGGLRVVHLLPDPFVQELTDLGVGLVGEEDVEVAAEPDPEPALVPAVHELALDLLVGGLQRALLQEVQLEAEAGGPDPLPDAGVVALAGALHVPGPPGRCGPGRCSSRCAGRPSARPPAGRSAGWPARRSRRCR